MNNFISSEILVIIIALIIVIVLLIVIIIVSKITDRKSVAKTEYIITREEIRRDLEYLLNGISDNFPYVKININKYDKSDDKSNNDEYDEFDEFDDKSNNNEYGKLGKISIIKGSKEHEIFKNYGICINDQREIYMDITQEHLDKYDPSKNKQLKKVYNRKRITVESSPHVYSCKILGNCSNDMKYSRLIYGKKGEYNKYLDKFLNVEPFEFYDRRRMTHSQLHLSNLAKFIGLLDFLTENYKRGRVVIIATDVTMCHLFYILHLFYDMDFILVSPDNIENEIFYISYLNREEREILRLPRIIIIEDCLDDLLAEKLYQNYTKKGREVLLVLDNTFTRFFKNITKDQLFDLLAFDVESKIIVANIIKPIACISRFYNTKRVGDMINLSGDILVIPFVKQMNNANHTYCYINKKTNNYDTMIIDAQKYDRLNYLNQHIARNCTYYHNCYDVENTGLDYCYDCLGFIEICGKYLIQNDEDCYEYKIPDITTENMERIEYCQPFYKRIVEFVSIILKNTTHNVGNVCITRTLKDPNYNEKFYKEVFNVTLLRNISNKYPFSYVSKIMDKMNTLSDNFKLNQAITK